MSSHVSNKQVILITGTSRGIGQAVAEALRKAGHVVYGSSRRGRDSDPFHLALDVTDPEACRRALAQVVAEQGRLDVLVNNAGSHLTGAAVENGLEEVRSQMELNFMGAVHMTQAVLPVFLEQRSGKLINMSSLGGLLALPFTSAYNASKFALEGYMSSLRQEVMPFGIWVSNLSPGYIHSGTVDQSILAPSQPHPLFASFREGLHQQMLIDSSRGLAMATVAHRITDIVAARRPRYQYKLGRTARMYTFLQGLLPEGLFHAAVRRTFALPDRVDY